MTDAPGTDIWDETWGDPPRRFTGRVNTYSRNGRQSHHYLLDGERVEGVTTIISKGVNKGDVLTRWSAKAVAEAAWDTAGYWRRLARDDVKDDAGKLVPGAISYLKNSPWRTKTEAGARGTEVHGWAEHYATHGTMPELADVDPVIRAQVEALGRFFTDWEVEILLSEVVIFSRSELYAGTCDLVAVLHAMDDAVALLDYKTSKGVYPETGLQLAAYRYGDFYLGPNGERIGMPGVDFTGVIHLPAEPKPMQAKNGGYYLVPLQADRPVYRTFLQAKAMAHFTEHGKAVVGRAVKPEAERNPT